MPEEQNTPLAPQTKQTSVQPKQTADGKTISNGIYYTVTLFPMLAAFIYVFGFTVNKPTWAFWSYIVGSVFLAVFVINFLSLLYRAWDIIQDGHARATPQKAVLLCLIPVFNFYWIFHAVSGYATDFNAHIRRHGKAAKRLPEAGFRYVLVFTFLTAVLLAGIAPLADWMTIDPLVEVNSKDGINMNFFGWFYVSLSFIVGCAMLVMWANVSSHMSNAINFFRQGPALRFPWSWLSMPSVLLVWMVLSYILADFTMPHVLETAKVAVTGLHESALKLMGVELQFGGPTLLDNIIASLREELFGFGAAVIVAVVLGFLAGFNQGYREYIIPLNGMFMSIPPIAWAPLMLAIFGLPSVDDWIPTAIIVVIFIAAVNPMIITIIEGVLQIQGTEVKAARVLGSRPWQLFVYVYLPASLPFITAALRIGFSQAWRALVAAEMIGATAGIGWSVSNSSEVGAHAQMLLGIALIGGLSWVFERLLFRPLEKHYEVWRLA